MATEKHLLCDTRIGAVDLTGKENYACLINSSGNLALGGDATGTFLITEGKTTAAHSTFCMAGFAKGILGGTVATGAWVKSDANGKLVAASAGDAALGLCLNGGAADTIQSILVAPTIASA